MLTFRGLEKCFKKDNTKGAACNPRTQVAEVGKLPQASVDSQNYVGKSFLYTHTPLTLSESLEYNHLILVLMFHV